MRLRRKDRPAPCGCTLPPNYQVKNNRGVTTLSAVSNAPAPRCWAHVGLLKALSRTELGNVRVYSGRETRIARLWVRTHDPGECQSFYMDLDTLLPDRRTRRASVENRTFLSGLYQTNDCEYHGSNQT